MLSEDNASANMSAPRDAARYQPIASSEEHPAPSHPWIRPLVSIPVAVGLLMAAVSALVFLPALGTTKGQVGSWLQTATRPLEGQLRNVFRGRPSVAPSNHSLLVLADPLRIGPGEHIKFTGGSPVLDVPLGNASLFGEVAWEMDYYGSTSSTTTTTITETTVTSTSTTSTTITSTTTVSTTITTTTTRYMSLYCFMVVMSHGEELLVVRNQFLRHVGVFACNDFNVFSDKNIILGIDENNKQVNTTAFIDTLEAPAGKREHILNTVIFLTAWRKVYDMGFFRKFSWVVKLDPDAVFVPDLLRWRLRNNIPYDDPRVYFLNCHISFQFFGAIEVLSSPAVEALVEGTALCQQNLVWNDWGEDLFVRRCLDMLGVQPKTDYKMLRDGYCEANMTHCNRQFASFHPYKAWPQWRHCYGQVTGATWAQGWYVGHAGHNPMKDADWYPGEPRMPAPPPPPRWESGNNGQFTE